MAEKVRYSWKWTALGGVPAEVAGPVMQQLSDRNGGRLTPEGLLDSARPKKSPLHECFEWDNAVAAEHCRLDQARYLIRNLVIRYVELPSSKRMKPRQVRVFYSEPEAANQFVSIETVMSDEDLFGQVVAEVKQEITELRDKLKALQDPRTRALVRALDRALAA
jgi:hypothetical protein